MDDWWGVMSQLEHVYWIIALIASLIFVILLIGTIIGGTDVDMDAVDADIDMDGGIGFQFLTVKNIVGFFTVFSWAGIASINSGNSNTMTIIISLIAGTGMMLIMTWLFLFMAKQAESGTLKIGNSIGEIGSLRELEAITDENEDLTQGNVIKVLEVVSGELLLVEKLKK